MVADSFERMTKGDCCGGVDGICLGRDGGGGGVGGEANSLLREGAAVGVVC